MNQAWTALGRQVGNGARAALAIFAVLALLAAAGGAYWLSRSDYQVLFANLAPQDVSAMTAELDRLKVPYRLSESVEGGSDNLGTILVNRDDVYNTRIKLMGRDIPLHGAIGFELFNNSDLGMTEFAQKINYQRALQGELTRTILSLSEVREARVLLALPDQGLFKQANKPKASITLSMKDGKSLRPEQVVGIQRLVSAAVVGVGPQDVTIVDQNGVALTRSTGDPLDADAGGGSLRLDLKKDTETYLARKATAVLENALGKDQALASVDVVLNMDRVRVDTDEVLSAPGKPGSAPTGVVTRQRESTRDAGPGLNGPGASVGGGSNQMEVDYAHGRRVEQVISQPGSVRRIQVAVVVRQALASGQLEQLRAMVAASVGASPDRGDSVIVQTFDAFHPAQTAQATPAVNDQVAKAHPTTAASRAALAVPETMWIALGGAIVALLALLVGLLWHAQRKVRNNEIVVLSVEQREEALARVRGWMLAAPDGRTGDKNSPNAQRQTLGELAP